MKHPPQGAIMAENILQEYDAKLDNKHRCVIHGIPAFDRYHIKVFESGKIELTPQVLVNPEELSENSLRMIYSSIRNMKKGVSGSVVDFEKHKEYLKEDE
jgi:hypothetical protein